MMTLPKLEYQDGHLVKVDGMRPEYIDGYLLISLVKVIAEDHAILKARRDAGPSVEQLRGWAGQLKRGVWAMQVSDELIKTANRMEAAAWTGPGDKPHAYSPGPMEMGDCQVCGHTREAHQ
jgi:hypothetical protein